MQYAIVYDTIFEWLEKKVNAKIKEGWTPIGGVSVCIQDGEEHFYQAMILADAQK